MATTFETAILTASGRVESLAAYRAAGGGEALDLALGWSPQEVIGEITRSGLRGRGGAGFPTGVKWESVRNEPGARRFLVCNAAEGEPGTFKDRWLIDLNPYQMIEGMQVAAHAVGVEQAFIGIKRGFRIQIERLTRTLREMDEAGMLVVPTEVVPGPDEYLFGEEKALLEVIEGNLPLPRILPPYQHGLFQGGTASSVAGAVHPTNVNNVETLSNVPHIIRRGADWFRAFGTERSPGTMVFTLSGDVQAPGLYELPLGVPLRTLIYDIGGGPAPGRSVKAAFPGASAAVLAPGDLDVPMDFDAMREAGTGLGSGGFVVYDDSTCIVEATLAFSRFLFIESCGQCPPCKIGSGAITDNLDRIQAGDGTEADLDGILARSLGVTDAARCALPAGESRIIQSAILLFRDEFLAHLGRACPAPRGLVVPKIESYDANTGAFTLDETYRRKLPNWTYLPDGQPEFPG